VADHAFVPWNGLYGYVAGFIGTCIGSQSLQDNLTTWTLSNVGGGTYFRCLKKTVILRKGQVLIHPGNLYHRGVDITSGNRILMVCFMDGFNMEAIDTSDPKQDFSKYLSDVVSF